MLESFTSSKFEYKKLSLEEQKSKGILGRLVGPISTFKESTRNGRKYTEKLWENVYSDPIVKEKIDNRCLFCELGHPEDRLETDPEKICACIAEVPKKNDKGELWTVVDVLDTPNGRILKTLLDYGTTVGISSRGEGDIITDSNGEEIVDPDTYQYETHDIVLVPAVKLARLSAVRESLDNKKNLKQALLEDLDKSNANDKLVMTKTLESLGIDLNEGIQYKGYDMTITQSGVQLRKSDGTFVQEFPTEQEAKEYVDEMNEEVLNEGLTYAGYKVELSNNGVVLSNGRFKKEFNSLDSAVEYANSNPLKEDLGESSNKDVDNIEQDDNDSEAKNDESEDDGSDLVVELQETLNENADLKKLVKNLQERLSVSYAKEKRVESQVSTYKSSIQSLQESNKKSVALENKVSALEKELEQNKRALSASNSRVSTLTEQLKSKDSKISDLVSSHKEKQTVAKELVDQLSSKVESLQEELESTKSGSKKSVDLLKESYRKKESDLNTQLADAQKDYSLKEQQLKESLQKANEQIERYKSIASKAVNRYITEKTKALGVSDEDVKNRLGKSYSFNDIDRICESLAQTKIAMNKLPFNTLSKKNVSIQTNLNESSMPGVLPRNDDDFISEGFMRLAGMN